MPLQASIEHDQLAVQLQPQLLKKLHQAPWLSTQICQIIADQLQTLLNFDRTYGRTSIDLNQSLSQWDQTVDNWLFSFHIALYTDQLPSYDQLCKEVKIKLDNYYREWLFLTCVTPVKKLVKVNKTRTLNAIFTKKSRMDNLLDHHQPNSQINYNILMDAINQLYQGLNSLIQMSKSQSKG